MKYLIILLFIISPVSADLASGTPLFTWTAPTQNTDGSPLNPATDLSGYPMYCNGATTPTFTGLPNATSYQSAIGEFAPGSYGCFMTAQSVGGVESNPTPFFSFIVPAAPVVTPNPITNPVVQ